jgi:hypothetical protein
MGWITDVTPGAWLAERVDTVWHDMHSVVPRGYEGYARVFHPIIRDRPTDSTGWHEYDPARPVDIESETTTWHGMTRAFGLIMHPLVQSHLLFDAPQSEFGGILDADGWRYSEPDTGNLDATVLARLATHLETHTTNPDATFAAIWEGWGGLVSSAGFGTFSVLIGDTDLAASPVQQIPADVQGAESATRDALYGAEPLPGTGLLPQEVAAGPRLQLPGRAYLLFETGVTTFSDPTFLSRSPWSHDRWPQSPSIIWPADRAWVVVTEIDFDSTIVAGSRALIDEIVSDPAIEALEVPEGADLGWEADTLNRPRS